MSAPDFHTNIAEFRAVVKLTVSCPESTLPECALRNPGGFWNFAVLGGKKNKEKGVLFPYY